MPDKETQRRNRLKKMLLDEKKRLWGELRDDLFRKLGNEYNTQFDNPHDIEELALIDIIEDTGLAVADIKRQELERMDTALRKLEDGTYGVCDECEEDIDEERLKAQPFAALCVKCKTGLEG
jgi:DnaK suppressor protein